jgi:hypothetical protein
MAFVQELCMGKTIPIRNVIGLGRRWGLRRPLGFGAALLSAGALLLVAGCARDRSGERQIINPRLPVFFGGAASLLLTNGGGYSARITEQVGAVMAPEMQWSGQLLSQGSKLRFEPDAKGSADKGQRTAGFSFLWDVAEGSGYIFSETLQGYAPIAPTLRATNVVLRAEPAASQKIEGHPCEAAEATVNRSDGSAIGFQVWRASDLGGLAMKIAAAASSTPLTLSLSRVRLERLPPDVFAVPNGFIKYASLEAMLTELTVRQHNLRRTERSGGDFGTEVEPPMKSR